MGRITIKHNLLTGKRLEVPQVITFQGSDETDITKWVPIDLEHIKSPTSK